MTKKVAVFGGNGFIGSHIAKALCSDHSVVCVSRSGVRPLHLTNTEWADSVEWTQGDAADASADLLSDVDTLISTIGSPPLPTFSKKAYEAKVFANGTVNQQLFDVATQAGVQRLVLIGAQIPFFLNTDLFAYTKGKRIAFNAAEDFAKSANRSATVLQPSVVVGRRHTTKGKPIKLDQYFALGLKFLPSQFVDVEKLAQRVATEVASPMEAGFRVIRHKEI